MKKPLRMTHQREVILQELRKLSTHPSADELYERIKKMLPRISLATVYRNLEILAEAGSIRKIEISGRQKRFDWDMQQHNHIYCVGCHRVDNIELEDEQYPSLHPLDDKGYRISGSRIEFFGYCPHCQQQKGKGAMEMGGKTCGSAALNDSQRKVLQALAEADDPCGSRDIAAASGLDAKQVGSQLTGLRKKGFVESPVRCKYAITARGKDALA